MRTKVRVATDLIRSYSYAFNYFYLYQMKLLRSQNTRPLTVDYQYRNPYIVTLIEKAFKATQHLTVAITIVFIVIQVTRYIS